MLGPGVHFDVSALKMVLKNLLALGEDIHWVSVLFPWTPNDLYSPPLILETERLMRGNIVRCCQFYGKAFITFLLPL